MVKPLPKPVKQKKKPNRSVSKKRRSIKTLINEADKIFSLYIRRRDGGSLYSGKKEQTQCSHLVSRGYWKYRWCPENCITLTYAEHIYGWHSGKMGEYIFWLKETYPEKYAFFEMAVKDIHTSTNKRPSISEMEGIISHLKELLASLPE